MVFGRTLIIYCNIYYPSCPFLGYLLLFVSFLVDSFVVGTRVSFSNGRKWLNKYHNCLVLWILVCMLKCHIVLYHCYSMNCPILLAPPVELSMSLVWKNMGIEYFSCHFQMLILLSLFWDSNRFRPPSILQNQWIDEWLCAYVVWCDKVIKLFICSLLMCCSCLYYFLM